MIKDVRNRKFLLFLTSTNIFVGTKEARVYYINGMKPLAFITEIEIEMR